MDTTRGRPLVEGSNTSFPAYTTVADPDTIFLALISGLLGAVVGGALAGYYAMRAVRRQSLRAFKQEAYSQALRSLDELMEIVQAIAGMVRLDVTNAPTALAQVTMAASSLSYFLTDDETLDATFKELGKIRVEPGDAERLKEAALKVRETATSVLGRLFIKGNHQFYNEFSSFELCQPSPEVLQKYGRAKVSVDELAAALSSRSLHQLFGAPDVSEDDLDKGNTKAETDLKALKAAMIADLKATLG